MTSTEDLSPTRRNLLRAGYLFMGVGLVIVKWPHLAEARTMPLYEGVTLCLLTAMSLLALLGVRHPQRLLPVLLFEIIWKLLWIGVVAIPRALEDRLDDAATTVLVNCTFVVVVIAVVPWAHVWRSYGRAGAEPWRRAVG
jgi:hypothetical protein